MQTIYSARKCLVMMALKCGGRRIFYRVFIKYRIFSEDFKIFPTLAFLCFPFVLVCVHTPQSFKEKTQYVIYTLYAKQVEKARRFGLVLEV